MDYDYKNIWRISIPIIISMLLTQLIGITDVAYLGRVSTVATGASGLGSMYFFSFFVLISGFSFGAQIIISRRNGESEYQKIGAVFYQGLSFLLLGALGLILISHFVSPYLLSKMISNQEVLEAAITYINIRILGLVAVSFLAMFRAFFVGIAQTFALQLISVSMVIFNVILNYVFIFGFGFIPALGIKGAAIASVLSEFLSVLVCVGYMICKTDLGKYALKTFVYKDLKLLKSILALSFWTMLQQFVSMFTWFLFFIAIEHLGADELAISNILKNSAGVPLIVIWSFGAASGTITGNLIGENRSDEVLTAGKKVVFLNTWVTFGMLWGMGVFYYPILRIYTSDALLIEKSVLPYFTYLLCHVPLFSGWVWFENVAATGNAKYSMWIETVSMVFYMLFIGIFIWALKMPLYICVLAEGVYNLGVFLMSHRFMYSNKWIGKSV